MYTNYEQKNEILEELLYINIICTKHEKSFLQTSWGYKMRNISWIQFLEKVENL